MDINLAWDTAAAGFSEATLALLESTGLAFIGLVFAAWVVVAFCLGRLIERELAQLRVQRRDWQLTETRHKPVFSAQASGALEGVNHRLTRLYGWQDD